MATPLLKTSPLADSKLEDIWNDPERLNALHMYEIIDTDEEEDFNDFVRLAAQICDAPVSLISFVEDQRQWFKARYGTEFTETPIELSFCRYGMIGDEVMVVEDATKDARFKDNALVAGDPNIRFYAGAPLKSAEGHPLGTLCVIDTKPRQFSERDSELLLALSRQVMTLMELRRALREKKRSEERLQFALDASAIVGTWDWDMRRNVVYCDPRFSNLFSIDPADGERGVSPETFFKAIHPEDTEHLKRKTDEAVASAGDFAVEYRLLNSANELRWIFARGKAFKDEHGKPERFPGVAVDITDRKRAERKQLARVELNDRLRDIKHSRDVTFVAAEIIGNALDCTRAGYGELYDDGEKIIIDRDWTNGKVQSLSGIHTFKSYGTEFAEKIKRGEVIVIDDVRQDASMADGIDSVDKIQVRSLINVSLIEDGKPRALFYLHDSKPRHWRRGEIDLVIEMAHRTWAEAERVHAENQMIEALKKAEAANMAKTEFLANMSHEIRTPMNAIIGLSNILSTENLTTRQKEFVHTLQFSADSLLSLINDLLDISKIEARTVELERIPFSLTKIVQEVISMMSMKAEEKGLSFVLDGDCAEGQIYIGDPTRLRQIITNLCSNALKFTDHGGIKISIGCHKTENPLLEDIHISVEDTGIGVPASKFDHIFEKFIQADTSINRKYGGTGLGLAITKMLTGLMGGTIGVESVVGKGSTFTIKIPLPLAAEGQKPEQSVDHKKSENNNVSLDAKNKILLVEDYAPNVLVAGTFLEEFGYEWESAKNGTEAVEKAIRGGYMAILMDVQMFGMNGLEATRMIREYEKKNVLKRVPIIGMTAHALSGDRERCIAVGMDDYLSKPFNPLELENKLREVALKVA